MSAKKRCFRSELFRPKKIPLNILLNKPRWRKMVIQKMRRMLVNVQASSKQAFLEKWRTHSPPVKPPSFPAWTWKVHHLPISGWISCCNLKEPSSSTCPIPSILLMVQKSQGQPPGMWSKHCKSWDFNYQPPSTGFCLRDFWLPSTVGNGKVLKGKIRWRFSAADPWRCPCIHTSTFHCPTSEEHLCTLSIL